MNPLPASPSSTAVLPVRLRFWPLLVIVALGINLRPMLTASGPLLTEIRAETGLGLQASAMLTVLPVLCMGVIPLMLPWLGRRVDEGAGIAAGLLAIALGCLWRLLLEDGSALVASAALAGVGVALIQALAPGVVKRWFPEAVPVAMGIYSASLMGGGGVAAILSPVVASHFQSWQAGIGIWFVLALFALILWLGVRPGGTPASKARRPVANFFGSRRAWLLAVYFGLANGGYAAVIAWLPAFAQQLGRSVVESGELIGVMTLFQVIAALSVPLMGRRQIDRRPWLILSLSIQLIGFGGLLAYPDPLLTLWAAVIGYGLGACFALALTLTLDHLPCPATAGMLAGFVQGVGFIITAMLPFVTGLLRSLTGGFESGWCLVLFLLLVMAGVTLQFAPSGYTNVMKPYTEY